VTTLVSGPDPAAGLVLLALAPAGLAALISAGITWCSMPLLQRYALARPNARSSHKLPTPQGAGIAVVAATLLVGWIYAWIPLPLIGSAVLIALVGLVDDIRPLPVVLRLLLQAGAVAAVVLTTPEAMRIVPALPLAAERILLLVGGVWFVNLVNFMDGLDWMTVAEVVPITACLAMLGLSGALPAGPALTAAALLGAMLGFAPFNKPVARLFLGDVGSLPIGLLVGWMLLRLAGTGALAAALLLPLYYLADATLTLCKRLARGERVWQAHRTHFYQQATDNGYSVMAVAAHVFGLNLALAALALVTLAWPAWPVQVGALGLGAGLVGLVLKRFAKPRLVRVAA